VNTESIVEELEAARDRLNQAIAALQGSQGRGRKAVRSTNGRKRHLSAAARKRISEGMKQRWAARKKAGKKTL
jgi:exonuclease VII small subunit